MSKDKFDLYAPYRMPDGRDIYGAAAANKRVADAGGFNQFTYDMVHTGMKMGYQTAINNLKKSAKR